MKTRILPGRLCAALGYLATAWLGQVAKFQTAGWLAAWPPKITRAWPGLGSPLTGRFLVCTFLVCTEG